MVAKKAPPARKPQYWLFVTRPEYYLDDDGEERAYLEPGYASEEEGWWTCDEDTKKGDLIFLYRTAPRSDIGYVLQAISDAFPIDENVYAEAGTWDFACEFTVLKKFKDPVTFKEIGAHPKLREWNAYRKNFQGTVFPIPPDIWNTLNELAMEKDSSYRDVLTPEVEKGLLPDTIEKEKDLEEYIFNNIGVLKKIGYDVALYDNPKKRVTGRQVPCGRESEAGRIDLLCRTRDGGPFVVVELKNVEASYSSFGQISSYMGWVKKTVAGGAPVHGLIISRGADVRLENALETNPNVEQHNIKELRLPTDR